MPKEETPRENANNEYDTDLTQQDLQFNHNDAEKPPENTDESQVTTLSQDNDELQFGKIPAQYTW